MPMIEHCGASSFAGHDEDSTTIAHTTFARAARLFNIGPLPRGRVGRNSAASYLRSGVFQD